MVQTRLKSRRIGMMGGAFDPPHRTHVALAIVACAQLQLDELHVVPTGQAWHKPRSLSAPEHRLAMARLAFAGLAQARIDDCEIRRAGPSYTLDTLEALRSAAVARDPASPIELFLVIGSDQAHALGSWHRVRDVLKIATICIAVRADSARANDHFDRVKSALAEFKGALRLTQLALQPDSLSATEIRDRVRRREDVTPLVGAAVARYIADHHLYLED